MDPSASVPEAMKTRWILPLAYMGLIWFLSSQPSDQLDLGFQLGDKILHAAAFAALALFCWWACGALQRRTWISLFVSVAYGAVDELHQLWGDAGRHGDFGDWAADCLGALIMVAFLHYWSQRRADSEEPITG